MPEVVQEEDVVHVFMGKVALQQAKDALTIADKLSDMILFHRRVRENGTLMMKTRQLNAKKGKINFVDLCIIAEYNISTVNGTVFGTERSFV